jgi:hypothetical protein
MAIYAFDFDIVDNEELQTAIDRAPIFDLDSLQNFKRLLAHSIGAVHAVCMKLHQPSWRDQLVVYYGRSTDDAQNVLGRWKSRGHRFGLVLGKVPTKEVHDAESDAIKLFSLIDQNDGLCIKKFDNLAKGGNGPLPSSKWSTLYLTWYFDRNSIELFKLTLDEVNDLADEAYDDLTWDLSTRTIRDILRLTRSYSHLIPLRWYPGHPE